MNNRYIFLAVIFFFLSCFQKLNGQDSIHAIAKPDSTFISVKSPYRVTYKKLIIPSVFIAYGLAGLKIDELRKLDRSTRYEIWEHQPGHIRLDNYTQYAPALMVYGLNIAGVQSKHNFKDRTIIYAASQLISSAFVLPLKHIAKEERPDRSNKLSFPSGHTATAFSSAQFMFREYKDTHFWVSISGYSFALFTGVYRTLNDKHWVSDVVAGAGFGILSTELAYCLYPKINALFIGKNKKATTMIIPVYQNKNFGIDLVKIF